MLYFGLAFLIGVVAGLRALTPVAAVSWAARAGRLHIDNTWLAFLGYNWTPYIVSVLAILELVNDKLPKTPSRKSPPQFITRVIRAGCAALHLVRQGLAWSAGWWRAAWER